MSATSAVTVDITDLVATVTLDRPPVNAVDRAALIGIRDAFRSLNDRRDVRAAILIAAGGRAFMGGADLTVLDGEPHGQRPPTEVKAREMYFLGEPVDAAQLHRLGTVRAVAPAERLLDTARELAGQPAGKGPIALRLAKEAMNRVEFLPLKDAYRTEQDYTNRLLTYRDSTEARAAFLEKRTPEWLWR